MTLYSKIDPASPESLPSGLDLFTTPFTQVAIEKTYEREYLTLNPVNESPYNFRVLTGNGFLIPDRTRIVVQMQLVKQVKNTETGTWNPPEGIGPDDPVYVKNGIGDNWIRNLKVMLQGVEIFNSNNLYSQFAYDEDLLNFPEDAKKSSMTAFGYYHENKGKSQAATTQGFIDRKNLFIGAEEVAADTTKNIAAKYYRKTVEFSAPLHADFFQQQCFLLNNTELDFEIYRHDDKYLLTLPKKFDRTKVQYRLDVTSIRLYCTFADLHPGVALELEKRLEKEPARYLMNRIYLKSVYYEAVRQEAQTTIFTDYIPDEMIISFTRKGAYNGDWELDDTILEHFTMENISVIAGNMEIPYVAYDMDWSKGKYIRAFEHLHRTLGQGREAADCGITREMFADGYFILPFILTPGQEYTPGSVDLIREGPTFIKFKTKENLPTGGIEMFVIGKWKTIMVIDQTRTVRTDLSV